MPIQVLGWRQSKLQLFQPLEVVDKGQYIVTVEHDATSSHVVVQFPFNGQIIFDPTHDPNRLQNILQLESSGQFNVISPHWKPPQLIVQS